MTHKKPDERKKKLVFRQEKCKKSACGYGTRTNNHYLEIPSTADKLLKGEVVESEDAARLVLEMLEGLGGMAAGLGRKEAMALLRQVVSAGVEVVKKGVETVSFRELVEACLEFKKGRVRPVTMRDLRSFTNRLLRVPGLAEKGMRSLGVEECRAVLDTAFAGSAHSYRKGRAILHGLFTFARRRGWCGEQNPVDAIESPRVEESRIEPLTLEEIQRLMEACEGTDMEAAVSLMLWCGVRPGEVQRLTWAEIDTQEGVVYIPPQHSKTGGARLIPLRGRTSKLKIENRKLKICPVNWSVRWRTLRHRAGFPHWRPDTLRHTFASYHALRFRNPPLLQSEMGHRDSGLLRTRYVNMWGIPQRVAVCFWR